MAAYTTVTVVTGKEITVLKGRNMVKYVGGETASIPTHEAVQLKSQGLVTY